ncbi:hypothetical protein ACJJTC_011121 [Scirpophaga incertulas]
MIVFFSGYTARRQWRALREGYMRYKRALKHHNNWQPYYWSKYLAFLDEGNILPTRSLGNDTSSSGTWNSFYYSPETLIEISNSSEIQVTDSLVLVPDMSSRNTEIGRTSRTMSTMGKYDKHKRREMSHFDSVDYLFLSYANTFKRMPMTQQVHLKVEMAKLFANAELDFMND